MAKPGPAGARRAAACEAEVPHVRTHGAPRPACRRRAQRTPPRLPVHPPDDPVFAHPTRGTHMEASRWYGRRGRCRRRPWRPPARRSSRIYAAWSDSHGEQSWADRALTTTNDGKHQERRRRLTPRIPRSMQRIRPSGGPRNRTWRCGFGDRRVTDTPVPQRRLRIVAAGARGVSARRPGKSAARRRRDRSLAGRGARFRSAG